MISHRARDENFKQPNAVVVIAAKEKRVRNTKMFISFHSFYCWFSILTMMGHGNPYQNVIMLCYVVTRDSIIYRCFVVRCVVLYNYVCVARDIKSFIKFIDVNIIYL